MNGTVMHVDLLEVLWTTPSRKHSGITPTLFRWVYGIFINIDQQVLRVKLVRTAHSTLITAAFRTTSIKRCPSEYRHIDLIQDLRITPDSRVSTK